MQSTETAPQTLTANQLDSAIRTIELLTKSHSATYRSTQNACRKIFELKPELKIKLNSSIDALMECVDTFLAEARADRDELLREAYAKELVAKNKLEKQEEQFTISECTSETYQREYKKALESYSQNKDYRSTYNSENIRPSDFNHSGWYDGYTDFFAGKSRWSDVDIASYKKPATTEVYLSEMDYYTFSDAVTIDLENQNEYVLNFYYPHDKTVENTVEFCGDKPQETWHKSKVNIDRNWFPGWRVTVAYACILPTPKPCMFRCTRNSAYRGHDVLGSVDISARQGHYIEAYNEKEAIAKMAAQFPHDKLGFTVTPWI